MHQRFTVNLYLGRRPSQSASAGQQWFWTAPAPTAPPHTLCWPNPVWCAGRDPPQQRSLRGKKAKNSWYLLNKNWSVRLFTATWNREPCFPKALAVNWCQTSETPYWNGLAKCKELLTRFTSLSISCILKDTVQHAIHPKPVRFSRMTTFQNSHYYFIKQIVWIVACLHP